MASRRKKSPSSKAREIPLPRAKRTDPPVLRIPTDPRTWPASRHAFGWARRHFFASPRPPWPELHAIAPELVARRVVREVMLAVGIAQFPRRRWEDWLRRRAEALYRIHRQFRRRLDGPHDREYCYTYMRQWLYIALRRTGWKHADLLPDEMWAGHPPTGESIPEWKRWRLPRAA